MATKNARIPLPVPHGGVRKDVDPMNMDPEMLAEGVNVLVEKRALRPRPAHQYEGWQPTEGWWRSYTEDAALDIAYKSAGTYFVWISATGRQLGYTSDGFSTVTYVNWGIPGRSLKRITYDTVNSLWIVVQDNGDVYSAPATWPALGSWTLRCDVSSLYASLGYYIGYAYDESTGNHILMVASTTAGISGPIAPYYMAYSTNGTTWQLETDFNNNQNGKVYGLFASSGGVENFVAADLPESILAIPWSISVCDATKLGSSAWTKKLESARTENFVDAVMDPDLDAGLMLEITGSTSKVIRTTDLGATFADTSLNFSNPEDFTRLFYETGTPSVVAVGRLMYVSADGTTWTQYAAPPFTGTIYGAVHDGTQWWFATSEGLWRAPSVDLASMEKVNSMVEFTSDDREHELVSATESEWRKLNQTTFAWDNIAQNSSYPAAGSGATITPGSTRDRWVFRPYWLSDHYYLLGANTANELQVLDPVNGDGAGGEAIRDVAGSPGKAKIVLVAAGRAVIANIDDQPYAVDSSDPVALGGFDSGWNGLNYTLLGDTPGEIIAGQEISSLQFVLFKTDAVYHGIAQVEFGGVAVPFRFELIKSRIQGPVSPHSLASLPDGSIMYLGQDAAVYVYDGTNCNDVGKHVRYALEGVADLDSLSDVVSWYDREKRLVWIWYPTTSGLMNRGIVIDPATLAAWDVILPETWNVACGGLVTLAAAGPRWNEMNILWREAGSMTWASSIVTEVFPLIGLEEDIWMRHRWDNATNYTDLGRPIETLWRPGYHHLSEIGTYATLHDIRHVMSQLERNETFTCRAKALDDEQYEGSSAIFGIGSSAQEFEASDSLTKETDERKTEFGISGMRFRYQMEGDITRRFFWNGGVARFRMRGFR